MDCPVCWDKFEDSAFSLTCGHLFHRKCIAPLVSTRSSRLVCPLCRKKSKATFHRHSIREVFFTSTTHPSEASSRTSGTHHARPPAEVVVRDQNLKHVDTAARAFEDVIVRLAETRLDAIEDAVGAQLLELDSERRRWKRQWKQAEQEVARLEAELREARRERDNLRKGIRKVEVKADGLEVSVFLTS
ncbi:hypothetical protein BJ912DRAFT_962731 [Pholiota molesta]|nr:hypothetical protein BJ912DRAFT_962731 [Pholiota molesta]